MKTALLHYFQHAGKTHEGQVIGNVVMEGKDGNQRVLVLSDSGNVLMDVSLALWDKLCIREYVQDIADPWSEKANPSLSEFN